MNANEAKILIEKMDFDIVTAREAYFHGVHKDSLIASDEDYTILMQKDCVRIIDHGMEDGYGDPAEFLFDYSEVA